MKLFGRQDLLLIGALTTALVVVFSKPISRLLDYVREIERQSGLTLMPALVLLAVAFLFHQYRRNHQRHAKAEAAETATKAAQRRAEELERLVTFGEALGWFGAVKLRHFGTRPLIEDDSVRSGSTTLVNARLGYRFDNGMRLWLDAINLFNAKSNQIAYYYESRLGTEPPGPGTLDRHIHPVEPLALRVTLAKEF